LYAIKRLLHHFVRHLLNRWGLAYYFCSADALHIFLLLRSLLLPIVLFFAKLRLKKIKSRQQRPKRYGAVVALLDGS
jgi:hypothetical protein